MNTSKPEDRGAYLHLKKREVTPKHLTADDRSEGSSVTKLSYEETRAAMDIFDRPG